MIRAILLFLVMIFCLGRRGMAVDVSFYSDQYFYGTYSEIKSSDLNPDNRFLDLPTHLFEVDIRPELKINFESFDFVVRPRFEFAGKNIRYDDPIENTWTSDSKADLTAAYIHWQVFDALQLNVGLETYQWGGAEILNPSNPFFHFEQQSKSFSYILKGEPLVRVGIDWTKSFTTTVISEPVSNNEPEWIAPDDSADGNKFDPKWVLKNELRTSSGDSYIGVVVGQGEKQSSFFGEYATVSFSDGISFYVDAKHQQGRVNFVPEDGNLVTPENAHDGIWTTAVGGIRYQGDFDYRLEYLFNEAGWSREEFQEARQSLLILQTTQPQNVLRFAKPGLELRTQQYLYASIRMADLGEKKDMTIFLRDLYSMADQSQALQFVTERNLSDSVVGYFEADSFIGDDETEFGMIYNYQISAGAKWTL